MENNISEHNLAKIQRNIEAGNIYLDSYPAQVHFLMIDKCNVKCIMCGGDYFKSKSGRMITLEKFKTMAANLKLENAKAIVLAGAGDPLLNKDLMPIIKFVKNTYPHITISVTTNGLALSATLAGLLLESEVAQVNISINSATRASYKRIMQIDGFDAVCKNAKAFIEQRNRTRRPVALQFSAAINRLNIEELPRLVELGKEIGINSINLFYTRFYPELIRHLNIDNPADRLENDASLFFHQQLSDEMVLKAKMLARQYGISITHEPLFGDHAPPCACTWPMTQLMVGFDGEIYPCGGSEVHFREKVEKGTYDFGNAVQGPIDMFWNSELYRSLRISSRQGNSCVIPECHCCANTISPNDIRSHIMQWDGETETESGQQPSTAACDSKPGLALTEPPLVSVIVPTYNRPDQLITAMKSILAQTYKNIEVIVVNDCGADVEKMVSSTNKNNMITYVKHGSNRGLAAARNTGIKVARGKYIAYLDDDDLFYPNHVETLVNFLETSEYKVAYTDAYRAHQEKKNGEYVVSKRDVPYSFDFDYDKILTTNFVPVLCFMHERSCVEEAGFFDEFLKRLEDWDMWIRMSRKFEFAHIKELTCEFAWRTDGTTMTSGQMQEFVEARSMISRKYSITQPHNATPVKFANMPKQSLTSIVILTFNEIKHTKECIESIKKHTPEPHEVIFVDNASTDGTVKWLKKVVRENSHYKLIENNKNLGFAKGCNQGIMASSGEYILLLNNDVIVSNEWLKGMLEVLNSAPDIGFVGPMTNNIADRQKVTHVKYSSLSEFDGYASQFREMHRYRRVPARRVIGFCMVSKRSLLEQIGVLDERFGIGTFEDDDLCIRSSLAGYRNVIAGDIFIHHYGSRSFIGNGINADSAVINNSNLFKDKWSLDQNTPLGLKLATHKVHHLSSGEYSLGNLDKAIHYLIDGIKYAPDESMLYWQLAEMLIDNKLFQDALEALTAMPFKDRMELRSIELQGYCKEGLGLLEEAREDAQRALSLRPTSPYALNLMGVLAYKQGDTEAAQDFFLRAIAADPSYGEPYTNLGVMKWTADQHEAGFKMLEKGFILSPEVPDCVSLYHSAIKEYGCLERSVSLFLETQDLYPRNKQIKLLLIDLLIQQEHFSDAMQEIEDAFIKFSIDDGLMAAALAVREKIGAMRIGQQSGTDPLISLCMITKNAESCLPICLRSIKPLVNEMIIVDTGSTDRTKEMGRVFGAQVFDHIRVKDFFTAINHAISKASGDWIFILNADEVIPPHDRTRFKTLTVKNPPCPAAYSFTTVNGKLFDQDEFYRIGGNGYITNAKTENHEVSRNIIRLFTRDSGVSYAGEIQAFLESRVQKLGSTYQESNIRIYQFYLPGESHLQAPADIENQAFEKKAAPSEPKKFISSLISIIILTFNELKYTRECIESIRKHTPEPHEIIFVDNASTDGTVKWLRKICQENPNYKFIENKKNLGFAKGCNQGIEASSAEYILLLNNDVIVTENWLSGMLECLNSASDTGFVGPMANNVSGPQKVLDSDYKTISRLIEFAKSFRERYRHRRISCRRIVGFCMLFRRALVDKIGLLDETFGTGNFEDDDYCLRATLAGCRNLIAGDVFIHHYGSRSFIGNRIDYGSQMSGNIKIFDEKWTGIDINTPLGQKVVAFNFIEKADVLSQQGKLDEAIAMFISGIKYAPYEKAVYYRLAEILLDAKLYKDALEAVQGMPQEMRDDLKRLEIIAYCEEVPEEAGQLADRILAVDKDYAAALNLKGIIAYKQGDNAAAADFFGKAITSDPGYGEPYTNLGILKWDADKKEAALDRLEKGFILSPTLKDNITLYHTAITELAQFARAEQLFKDAKELHSDNKRILFFLIDILIQQGKFDVAMHEIERAMLNMGSNEGMLAAALEIRAKVGIKEIDKAAKNKGSLSLCMIVKNEEQHLTRCLLSATPAVDEMIVVDTGSTDKTTDIARVFGARVFDFPWTNDFSEARNYSLSKASGDWVLVLDADEVISPLDYAAIEKIVKKKPAKPAAYALNTRNYTNEVNSKGWIANDRKYLREEAGTGWFPSAKVRLFVNDQRIQFQNPVHEFVEESLKKARIEVRNSDIPIHHYGRFDRDKIMAKGREYFLLGKKKIEEMKGDIQALKELAIQASELDEYVTAVELWKKVIELNRNDVIAFLNIGYAYMKLNQYEEAFFPCCRAMELDPTMKEAALNYAGCEFIIGDVKKTISVLETLLQKEPDYPPAVALLAAAYYVDGQKEEGLRLIEKLRKKMFCCTDLFDEQTRAFMSQGRYDQALSLLEAAVKTGNVNNDTQALLAECYSKKTTCLK